MKYLWKGAKCIGVSVWDEKRFKVMKEKWFYWVSRFSLVLWPIGVRLYDWMIGTELKKFTLHIMRSSVFCYHRMALILRKMSLNKNVDFCRFVNFKCLMVVTGQILGKQTYVKQILVKMNSSSISADRKHLKRL